MANKIRKNDTVIVITGKYKGKTGKVIKVLKHKKLLVEGVNLAKKHQKPSTSTRKLYGITEKELKIDHSNVALFNSKTKKADKIGFRFEKGKKIRFFKSNNEQVK